MSGDQEDIFLLLAEHEDVAHGQVLSELRKGWRLRLIGVGLFLIPPIFSLFYRSSPRRSWLSWVTLLSFIASEICFFVPLAIDLWNSFKWVLLPTKYFLMTARPRFNKDMGLTDKLMKFPKSKLRFVSARLTSESEDLRSRVGLITGAIDKVGVFPLAATSGLTIVQLAHKIETKQEPSLELEWVYGAVAILGVLYLIGTVMTVVSHRVKELAGIVDAALEKKEESEQDQHLIAISDSPTAFDASALPHTPGAANPSGCGESSSGL